MQVGNLIGGFPAMNGEITSVDPQAERDDVELSEFDAAPGEFFEGRDDVPPDLPLEGIGGDVPAEDREREGDENTEQQQQSQPQAAPRRSRLAQRF